MVSFEQSIVNWILVVGVIAILYGLRYLVLLERRLFGLERSLRALVGQVEEEERRILAEEKMIEKEVGKPSLLKRLK